MKHRILSIITVAFVIQTLWWLRCPLNVLSLPKPLGVIRDYAHVIDLDSQSRIESVISELEQKTSAQIAVATVSDLGEETIQQYANELFSAWKIGQKGKDNGILIVLALKERSVWIEVGYGLEPIIPDAKAGYISREVMAPYFKKENYGAGILYGTAVVADLIARDAGVVLSHGLTVPIADAPKKISPFAQIFNIIIFIVLAFFFIRHPWLFLFLLSSSRYGGFGGGGFSGRSGGFGGFGGGMSGGGGGGGRW